MEIDLTVRGERKKIVGRNRIVIGQLLSSALVTSYFLSLTRSERSSIIYFLISIFLLIINQLQKHGSTYVCAPHGRITTIYPST